MTYRYNISYVLSHDQDSEMLFDLLSPIILSGLYSATIYLICRVTMFHIG